MLLDELISHLRNIYTKKKRIELTDVVEILSNESKVLEVKNEISAIFSKTKWVATLADSGLGNYGLFSEANTKFYNKILPPVQPDDELFTYINLYFNNKNDYKWLRTISLDTWKSIFDIFDFKFGEINSKHNRKELLNSLFVLSHKIASLGIDKSIISKLPQVDELDSPFLGLNRETIFYIEKELQNSYKNEYERQTDKRQIVILLGQCKTQLTSLYRFKDKFGISLTLTIQIRKLEKYIIQIEHILALLDNSDSNEIVVRILNEVVEIQNVKNSLTNHFSKNLEFLSFKIVENTSRKGEDYIARTRKQYFTLFKMAMGGGFIVAFLCVFKTSIYYLKLPLLWEAFFYSLNYSLGFVLIHILRFTLATKQPAMTASTIAASFVAMSSEKKWLDKPIRLLTSITRSQFISLVGNAILAFPGAYLIDIAVFALTNQHIAETTKSNLLLHELDPIRSLSLVHAAIAGVYLSISGLIAGYYENKWVYNNLNKRISQNPYLSSVFSTIFLKKVSTYFDKNFGSIMGNLYLGLFLGSTSTIGKLIGIPLDIRHITFASGNLGIAFASLEHNVPIKTLIICVLGVMLIGLVNVLVSFSISIIIAAKSRGISSNQLILLIKNLSLHFFTNGKLFFLPASDKK